MSDKKTTLKDLSYEELIEKLDSCVSKLDDSDLPLEEAINAYKEGLEISNLCKEKLESAKKVVVSKMENN